MRSLMRDHMGEVLGHRLVGLAQCDHYYGWGHRLRLFLFRLFFILCGLNSWKVDELHFSHLNQELLALLMRGRYCGRLVTKEGIVLVTYPYCKLFALFRGSLSVRYTLKIFEL